MKRLSKQKRKEAHDIYTLLLHLTNQTKPTQVTTWAVSYLSHELRRGEYEFREDVSYRGYSHS
jgi:hypothetical protein